jgi:hypothetical protein
MSRTVIRGKSMILRWPRCCANCFASEAASLRRRVTPPPRHPTAASLRRRVPPPPRLTAAAPHRRRAAPPPAPLRRRTAPLPHRSAEPSRPLVPPLRRRVSPPPRRSAAASLRRHAYAAAVSLRRCAPPPPRLLVVVVVIHCWPETLRLGLLHQPRREVVPDTDVSSYEGKGRPGRIPVDGRHRGWQDGACLPPWTAFAPLGARRGLPLRSRRGHPR